MGSETFWVTFIDDQSSEDGTFAVHGRTTVIIDPTKPPRFHFQEILTA